MIAVRDLPPAPDRAPLRRALLSVFDKTGLVDLARALARHGVALVSTGGSARTLREAGLDVTDVADLTGAPELLGGRVKTLHPVVYGGILYRRTDPEDVAAVAAHGLAPFDLVAVNLYPFADAVAQDGADDALAAENIDIGGPAMARAAAKNFAHVAVLTSPDDYAAAIAELDAHGGTLGLATRRRLAHAAFARTAAYDAAIAAYFGRGDGQRAMGDGQNPATAAQTPPLGEVDAKRTEGVPAFPSPPQSLRDSPPRGAVKATYPDGQPPTANSQQPKAQSSPLHSPLRYGENPHQAARLVGDASALYRVRHGKALSYNNLLDLDAALRLMEEFREAPPTLAILKHTNPCGVATRATLADAYDAAFATDTQSPFGGIVVVNRLLDRAAADRIDAVFTELVVAPGFEAGVLDVLMQKANRRLIDVAAWPSALAADDVRSVAGGLLVQERDAPLPDADALRATWTVVTERHPTDAEWADLDLAWRVAKHVKSNAIVYAKGGATVGIGAGQMSRLDSAEIAVAKAKKAGLSLDGAVVASDAFFPFADGLEAAAAGGVRAAVQPGGSVRDAEVIDAANRLGLAMVFTHRRHFRH